jgi:multiple sugar transport system permease protein
MSVLVGFDPILWGAWRRRDWGGVALRVLVYLLLVSGGFVFALPALWMLSTALKPLSEVNTLPPVWIPTRIEWANFTEPFQEIPFARFYQNTLVITLVSVFGMLFSCTPVAYAFARLRFRGRNVLFVLVLATVMLPEHATLVPMYVFFANLGWINTILPLTVPRFFAVDGFVVFLMRQFFLTLPSELDDACKIDGGSHWIFLTRILVPLSMPMYGVIFILYFVGYWNDFFYPLVFLNNMENYTVALGLRLFQTRYFVETNTMMAMALLASLPTIALFFIAQRAFIQGIVLTGVRR